MDASHGSSLLLTSRLQILIFWLPAFGYSSGSPPSDILLLAPPSDTHLLAPRILILVWLSAFRHSTTDSAFRYSSSGSPPSDTQLLTPPSDTHLLAPRIRILVWLSAFRHSTTDSAFRYSSSGSPHSDTRLALRFQTLNY
jgi:hypothetical protein